MTTTKNNLKSLSDIFVNDIQFIVPDYQRGYSWGEEQLDDLWEDLENITGNRYHYTGMFTFCKSEFGERCYSIVDGQQRMTTLIILINELLKRIEGGIPNGDSVEKYKETYLYKKPYGAISFDYRFRYGVDEPSDAFFKTEILGQVDSSSPLHPKDTLYTKNLRFAKAYFAEKIKDMNQIALADVFKKVTERLKFNEYMIDDINDVYVTFETMNNRGKSLSTLELLKNRLIYLSTLYENMSPDDSVTNGNVKELCKNINNAWKTIYEILGKSSHKILWDDDFLRDHWIMYFRYDRTQSQVFKKDLLSEFFTAKKVLGNELSIQEINDYVLNLQQSARVWFNINCPTESELSADSQEWLTRLNRVGIGSFCPLLMAAYLHAKKEHDILALVKACERFRFLVSAVSYRRANTADSHFYTLAHSYFVNPSGFNLLDDVTYQTGQWTNIPGFVNTIADLYQRWSGFFDWKGIRYFLYEYEKHLQSQGDVKVDWSIFEKNQSGKVSIEHVYPQSPTDSYWTSRFISDADKGLTHSLGNLLLLSISKNASLQNEGFDKKKTTVRNPDGTIVHNGYDNGSYSEIEVSHQTEWTPEKIIERGKHLLGFLKTHWQIDYDFSEEEYNKLLNIKGTSSKTLSQQVAGSEMLDTGDTDNDSVIFEEQL
jgi:hypothetical protein